MSHLSRYHTVMYGNIDQKLQALRQELEREAIDAYVIPSSDPHQSEYPPDRWKQRAWMSGFDGSSGTLVVAAGFAGLWTDSRYFLAAEEALAGTEIVLFRHGTDGVSDFPDYLAKTLPSGATVGFCGTALAESTSRRLASALDPQGVSVRSTDDLVDRIWADRPSRPGQSIYEHDIAFAARSRREKLNIVRNVVKDAGAEWCVLSSLDDIAWLLNLRGSDVAYNPVFLAYVLIGLCECSLYIDATKVPAEVRLALESDGVTIREYEEIDEAIAAVPASANVLVDPDHTSAALYSRTGGNRVDRMNPTAHPKACKTNEEIQHVRECMVRDGVAMVGFLHWVVSVVGSGETPSEYDCQKKLLEFRRQQDRFVSESFNTISAFGANAPIVHYAADPHNCARLSRDGLYLVDSGGQYLDGTTDITRTVALGNPSSEQRIDYTRVLRAHIALATTVFPSGTTGNELDAIARRPLWSARENYGHGTGHGVGYFLNVHEGPQRISPRPTSIALQEGMIVSNEPGIYRPQTYGIRLENLIVVTPEVEAVSGGFHEFETLTLCPFDLALVESTLMTAEELVWLNSYHSRVWSVLSPLIGSPEERAWLQSATREL